MKIILSLVTFVLCVSAAFSQNQKPNVKITGTVKEIAMQGVPKSDPSFYITYIKLNLKLENKGSVPVIFLQPNPIIKSATVVTTKEGNEILLAKTLNIGSSFAMMAKDWGKFKAKLDKTNPPKKRTRFVKPNEIFEFEGFIRLNIPKSSRAIYRPDQNSKTETVVILDDEYENETLDFMKRQSPAQINIISETCSTLSLILNGKSGESKKIEFANKLRNKWKNVGYLWTEDIEAEPISIDFNSVIFKTLID